jgi:hypothetical protein
MRTNGQNATDLPHRRGTVYVLVLISAMIVAIIGLVGVTVVRQDLARSEISAEAARASVYAQSAVELGLTELRQNSSWRTTLSNGGTVFTRSIGRGSASLMITDPADADLADSATESFVLRGTGASGSARQMVEVTIIPSLPPLPALACTLTSGNTIAFSNARVKATAPIWAAGAITAASSTIVAETRSAGNITGSTYTGTRTNGAAAPSLPDRAAVVAAYASVGTSISFSSLAGGTLQRVAISPTRNPLGSTNAQGVYVIDSGGQDLTIRDCRIVGTLLVRNAATVTLAGSVLLQSTSASMPALIVDGHVDVQLSASDLSEGSLLTNFNPTNAAYEGTTDLDTSDFYPSQIQGLVAIGGNLTIQSAGTLNVVGPVIVNGKAIIEGAAVLTDDADCATSPATGFTDAPTYRFDDATWRRAVD